MTDWVENLTGDENGNPCVETTPTGAIRRLTQNTGAQPAEPGQSLYFRARVFIPTNYVGTFDVGCEQLNAAGSYLSTNLFSVANVDLVKNSWQTLRGTFQISNSNTASFEPFFQLPAGSSGSIVRMSRYELGSTSPGAVEFIGGTASEVIELNSQIALDLTLDNGVTIHPSSVTVNAVTQHEGGLNSLNLLNGPSEAGATNGAQFGINMTDEDGAAVSNKNALNYYAPSDNLVPDGNFEDVSNRAWYIAGAASVGTSNAKHSGTRCVSLNAAGALVQTNASKDLLIPATDEDSYMLSLEITGGQYRIRPVLYNAALTHLNTGEYFDQLGVAGWGTISFRYNVDATYPTSEFLAFRVEALTSTPVHIQRMVVRRIGTMDSIVDYQVWGGNNAEGSAGLGRSSSDLGIYKNGLALAFSNSAITSYREFYSNYAARFASYIDYNDSGKYLDPAGTSVLETLNATTSTISNVYVDRVYDKNDYSLYLDIAGQSRLSSLITNAITDLANSSFYLNMAGTSVFNTLSLSSITDRDNAGYYWNGASTSRMNRCDLNDTRSDIFYDRNNTSYYTNPDSTSRMNVVDANTLYSTILYCRENNAYYLNLDGTSRIYRADITDTRSDIYYDRNDTSHYTDPAGASIFDRVVVNRYSAGISSIQPSLELGQGGAGSQSIAFHRSGQAVMFGLDTDNIIKLGFWSWGDVFSWRGSGQFTAAGSVYTPILKNNVDTIAGWDGYNMTLRGTSPTVYHIDTDNRSAFVHVNSNRWYVLGSTTNGATTWAQQGGQWPVYCDLTTNWWYFGNGANFVGAVNASTSDERLKENFRPFDDPIGMLNQLDGGLFDWRVDFCKSVNYTPEPGKAKNDVGLRAQQVQKVLPAAVAPAPFDSEWWGDEYTSRSGEHYLTVKYEKVVPLLVESIKAQQLQIEELTKLIKTKTKGDKNGRSGN